MRTISLACLVFLRAMKRCRKRSMGTQLAEEWLLGEPIVAEFGSGSDRSFNRPSEAPRPRGTAGPSGSPTTHCVQRLLGG